MADIKANIPEDTPDIKDSQDCNSNVQLKGFSVMHLNIASLVEHTEK